MVTQTHGNTVHLTGTVAAQMQDGRGYSKISWELNFELLRKG